MAMKSHKTKSLLFYALVAALGFSLTGPVVAQPFTTLHSFTPTSSVAGTNSDGAYPYGALILSDKILYGTTSGGGVSGAGTVFAVHTDGTGFTNLYTFSALSGLFSGTNADGFGP